MAFSDILIIWASNIISHSGTTIVSTELFCFFNLEKEMLFSCLCSYSIHCSLWTENKERPMCAGYVSTTCPGPGTGWWVLLLEQQRQRDDIRVFSSLEKFLKVQQRGIAKNNKYDELESDILDSFKEGRKKRVTVMCLSQNLLDSQ